MDAYAKACNAGDAEGVAALMTDKTTVAVNNASVLVGNEPIKSAFGAYFSQVKVEFSAPVQDVRVAGDLAVARGTWTGKFIPKAQDVAPIADSGSWIVILARQNDGSWKWDCLTANSNQPLPGSTASGEDEQAIFQLERDWVAAGPKKDTAALDKMLANEFVINWDGRIQNKKQFLAAMKANPTKMESAANSEMRAMVFGDTAVVHCLYTEKSTLNGKDTGGTYRGTDILIKRDGRWQGAISYGTKVQ
jgi:uncharacterized protein (TIGR02246 family)